MNNEGVGRSFNVTVPDLFRCIVTSRPNSTILDKANSKTHEDAKMVCYEKKGEIDEWNIALLGKHPTFAKRHWMNRENDKCVPLLHN